MGKQKIKTITFTDTMGIPKDYHPKPASKVIPQWYKNLNSYVNGDKKPDGVGGTTATAKKCMPIFDAISAGYILFTHSDLYISQTIDDKGDVVPHYEWANFGAITFHPKEQLPEHPSNTGHKLSYPKWMNAWSIKTSSGYSTLFIPPIHRETPITILQGIVDTDTFTAPVNFPFVLKNPTTEGLIPAGTPIAQVIPIKRDDWKMQYGNEKDLREQENVMTRLETVFFDRYKRLFRQRKDYN